jgi:hypothetical protein
MQIKSPQGSKRFASFSPHFGCFFSFGSRAPMDRWMAKKIVNVFSRVGYGEVTWDFSPFRQFC